MYKAVIENLGFSNSFEIYNSISDDTAPNFTSLIMTPIIDLDDNNRKKINIKIELDEQDTSIRDIYIRLYGPSGSGIRIDEYIDLDSTISLPLESPSGTYNVSYIFVNDQALNEQRYNKDELDTLGFDSSVTFGNN